MSITIVKSVLVPSTVSQEDADKLQSELTEAFGYCVVQRDVKREIHALFENSATTIEPVGLVFPDVRLNCFIDTGGDFISDMRSWYQLRRWLSQNGFQLIHENMNKPVIVKF